MGTIRDFQAIRPTDSDDARQTMYQAAQTMGDGFDALTGYLDKRKNLDMENYNRGVINNTAAIETALNAAGSTKEAKEILKGASATYGTQFDNVGAKTALTENELRINTDSFNKAGSIAFAAADKAKDINAGHRAMYDALVESTGDLKYSMEMANVFKNSNKAMQEGYTKTIDKNTQLAFDSLLSNTSYDLTTEIGINRAKATLVDFAKDNGGINRTSLDYMLKSHKEGVTADSREARAVAESQANIGHMNNQDSNATAQTAISSRDSDTNAYNAQTSRMSADSSRATDGVNRRIGEANLDKIEKADADTNTANGVMAAIHSAPLPEQPSLFALAMRSHTPAVQAILVTNYDAYNASLLKSGPLQALQDNGLSASVAANVATVTTAYDTLIKDKSKEFELRDLEDTKALKNTFNIDKVGSETNVLKMIQDKLEPPGEKMPGIISGIATFLNPNKRSGDAGLKVVEEAWNTLKDTGKYSDQQISTVIALAASKSFPGGETWAGQSIDMPAFKKSMEEQTANLDLRLNFAKDSAALTKEKTARTTELTNIQKKMETVRKQLTIENNAGEVNPSTTKELTNLIDLFNTAVNRPVAALNKTTNAVEDTDAFIKGKRGNNSSGVNHRKELDLYPVPKEDPRIPKSKIGGKLW